MRMLLSLLAVAALTGCSGPRTPDAEARTLMNLPASATVASVKHGDWAGDFVISFSMPTGTVPTVAISNIWRMNLSRPYLPTGPVVSGPNSISSRSGGSELREIRHLPSTGTYEYEQMLEK